MSRSYFFMSRSYFLMSCSSFVMSSCQSIMSVMCPGSMSKSLRVYAAMS